MSAALTASYQCVLRFFHSTCLKYCACHVRSAAPVTQNHLSKLEDLMLQNATPLRKRKTTSERPKVLQTPQFFPLLTSKCASRLNSLHFFDISTSKSAPNPSVFCTFDFEMCFAPQWPALFRHLNFQKCSEPVSFLHF